MSSDLPALAEWRHHWQDEADAAFLYRELASVEADPQRKDIFGRLADVEQRHVELWDKLLREHGAATAAPRPTRRARFSAWLARRFGPGLLLPLLLREEGQEVKGYLALHRSSAPGAAQETALTLAQESAQHAQTLQKMSGGTGEPWHKAESGGILRNVIYGFNDGLTANFGLVAGVVGASVEPRVLLVSGLAGALADALSMGSSSFLAAKSEQEVYAHEIAMEKEELRLMPETEEAELALLYEAKGLSSEPARRMAAEVMRNPQQALAEQVREELKIGAAHATPSKEGWITGSATLVGALIPVAPFLLFPGEWALWISFAVSMLAHFAVGALRSLFTGRELLRSGFDMFVVGLGIAGVGYLVGHGIMNLLSSTAG